MDRIKKRKKQKILQMSAGNKNSSIGKPNPHDFKKNDDPLTLLDPYTQ